MAALFRSIEYFLLTFESLISKSVLLCTGQILKAYLVSVFLDLTVEAILWPYETKQQ